jgi:hypothetical protein
MLIVIFTIWRVHNAPVSHKRVKIILQGITKFRLHKNHQRRNTGTVTTHVAEVISLGGIHKGKVWNQRS